MNHNKKKKKRLAIDKKSAILDISPIQFDIDIVGDEIDNDIWIFQSNLNSAEVKESVGADIIQILKRTTSGSEK